MSEVQAIDLVAPDVFDTPGGIARMARALALALSRWADRRGALLTVHALRDRGGRHKLAYLPAPHAYRSYDGRRAALARAVLGDAWRMRRRVPRAPQAIIFAHPHLAALGLALPPTVKIAVVAHGIEVWQPLRWERRLALVRADAVWPVSADTARHVRRQGVREERVRVIANALDPLWPLPPPAETRGGYVLAVSRLDPEHTYKGIDRVIEALARIAPPVPLVVAGDGRDRARLEALAARAGVEARFCGAVSDAALADLYRGARAFVMPSTGEGFGLVYLEAMAFGLPCVAARAGGAPEVVEHGVTGVTVEAGDAVGLCDAVTRVLGDEGAAMGAAGRARLERTFSYAAYESRVHAALDALLA